MQSVLQPALFCVVGSLAVEDGPAGVTFPRVPATARARLRDPLLDFASDVASGVRIEALTDAAELELDLALTSVLLGDIQLGTTVDLLIDGELQDPVHTMDETLLVLDAAAMQQDFRPGGPATLRFGLGHAAAERRVEIWLPHRAATRLLDVRVSDGASLRPAPPSGPLWVHHGSSISQASEADRPTGTWPALVARAAGRSLMNLGLAGQCHLDQFMARAIRELPATAISLELGMNVVNADSMRERAFTSALHGFLDTIRDGHPDTPVLVVTPTICPAAEDRPGPTFTGTDWRTHVLERPAELKPGSLSLGRVRELLSEHVTARCEAGEQHLHLLDGLELFGPDDIDELPDGLHPNDAGQPRMAERFLACAFGDEGVLSPATPPRSTGPADGPP